MWNFEYTLPNENECEGKAQGLYQITSIDNFMCYGHVMCVIDHPQAWTLDDFRCFISWIRLRIKRKELFTIYLSNLKRFVWIRRFIDSW